MPAFMEPGMSWAWHYAVIGDWVGLANFKPFHNFRSSFFVFASQKNEVITCAQDCRTATIRQVSPANDPLIKTHRQRDRN